MRRGLLVSAGRTLAPPVFDACGAILVKLDAAIRTAPAVGVTGGRFDLTPVLTPMSPVNVTVLALIKEVAEMLDGVTRDVVRDVDVDHLRDLG